MISAGNLYEAIDGREDYAPTGVFYEWTPGKRNWIGMAGLGLPGGYKIHITINPAEDEQAAAFILPFLRDQKIFHKIVASTSLYGRLNSGNSRGKFITLYVGPFLSSFTALVKNLDMLLALERFKPGPKPLERVGNTYIGEEPKTGTSGLLSYTTKVNYED